MGMNGPWSIPVSWIWVQMGNVSNVVGGGTPRTGEKSNFEGGDIPWITPADLSGYKEKLIVSGARNITQRGLTHSSAKLLPKGSVLFSSRAPVGYVAIAARPVTTNQGFKSFVLPRGIDPNYIYYYLLNSKELVNGLTSGTTFDEISGANARRIPLALPPLPEQHRIVAAIEQHLTRLDNAVTALQRVQANLQRYRASVLKTACAGQLVPTEAALARAEGRDYEHASKLLERILAERRARWEAQPKRRGRYKEPAPPDTSTMPQLPDGWVWCSVGQLAAIGTGSTPLTSKQEFYSNGTVPWIKSSALNNPEVETPTSFVTEQAVRESNLSFYPPHTLLVAMYGEGKTRGKCSELLIRSTINQAIAAINMRESAANCRAYTKVFLDSNYEETRRHSSGGVQPNLNLGLVGQITVPLPPVAEQRRIVAEVERRLSVIRQAETAVETSLKRAERLRQSILKAGLSGQLVPQDPNDEPAAVLLARIQAERAAAEAAAKARRKPRRRRKRRPAAARQLSLAEGTP